MTKKSITPRGSRTGTGKPAPSAAPIADGYILGRALADAARPPIGFAPVAAAMPNLLNHPGQAIVVDVKGTLVAMCRRRRAAFGKVHVLNFVDDQPGDSLNPLDMKRRGGGDPQTIGREIASDWIVREDRQRFWDDLSESTISGLVAHLIADRPPIEQRLSFLLDELSHHDAVMRLAVAMDDKQIREPSAVNAVGTLLGLPERETRPCAFASVIQHLRLFNNRLVRRLTDTTSIDLDAFIAGEPMTIFLVVSPSRVAGFALLIKVYLSGLLQLLSLRTSLPEHRTLVLVDEIAALGEMEAFVTASTLMREWGVTLWTLWQSLGQIEAIYPRHARTIVDNAAVLQMFGARNRRCAEDFTRLVGGYEPDRLMALGRDEQLLLIEGGAPRIARTVRYYDDPAIPPDFYDPNPLFNADLRSRI